MAMIDPEQERRRLAEFYSHQMDGELEKVAKQAYELTDVAREALRSEFARRELSVELVELRPVPPAPAAPLPLPGDPPPEPPSEEEFSSEEGELELRKMVTIRQFRDLPEALLAKGRLESAGIECALGDDNTVRMDWFWSNAVGGIKLQVDAEDADLAEDVFAQPIPEHLEVSEVGDYEQPRCPNCGSLDTNFRELDPATYFSLALTWLGVGVPVPIHRRAWRCHSCDTEWEDDGVPGTTESPA